MKNFLQKKGTKDMTNTKQLKEIIDKLIEKGFIMNELEMKKIALQHVLNVTYGGITTVKPNIEQLTKFQKEYDKVKKQLHDRMGI